MTKTTSVDGVRRRRVFYIPGYDPFHPRRYRELYRKESAAQAAISGYEIRLRAAGHGAAPGWQVTAEMDGQAVTAEIEVLVWSDIVRSSMSHGIGATYLQLVRTIRAYVLTGAIFRLARLRKGPTIAAIYPVGMLLSQLALAALVVWFGTKALYGASHWIVPAVPGSAAEAPISLFRAALALLLSAAGGVALLNWFRAKDGRLFAYYLMHDYAFAAQEGGAIPDALSLRLAEFGARIEAALAEEWDEVLVVGHSSGAHLGVTVLADLARRGRIPAMGPVLSFLSLGHVVPMVSFLPRAERLRGDLAYLSSRPELTWIDVTAPGDGCAFALCDPVAVSGVAPPDQRWPLILSAAFTQTLSPERWAALRWRFFRLHFQYLCAFDRPGVYDYFRITAGPLSLAARFAGRQPSKGRIDTPLNRYRSVA